MLVTYQEAMMVERTVHSKGGHSMMKIVSLRKMLWGPRRKSEVGPARPRLPAIPVITAVRTPRLRPSLSVSRPPAVNTRAGCRPRQTGGCSAPLSRSEVGRREKVRRPQPPHWSHCTLHTTLWPPHWSHYTLHTGRPAATGVEAAPVPPHLPSPATTNTI